MQDKCEVNMSRHIDADELEKSLEDSCDSHTKTMYFMEFMEYVDEQPTVDAAEVIQCKNCEHSQLVNWKRYCTGGFSTVIWPVVDDDDYCSNAERKMND